MYHEKSTSNHSACIQPQLLLSIPFSAFFLVSFEILLTFISLDIRLQSDEYLLTALWLWKNIPDGMPAAWFVHLCFVRNKNSSLKVVLGWFEWKSVAWYIILPAFHLLEESTHAAFYWQWKTAIWKAEKWYKFHFRGDFSCLAKYTVEWINLHNLGLLK